MSRLRHPVRAVREPFGKAGLTVAILALVFAMVGGAWAAAGLNGKQKKEVKTIAKSFQGTGPAGAAGTNGTNGTNGKDGKDGAPGAAGTNGTPAEAVSFSGALHGCTEGGIEVKSGSPTTFICNGAKGTNGTNAEAVSFSGALHGCTEGGIEVKSAKPTTFVCNGKEGKEGKTGFASELPPGETETGGWSTDWIEENRLLTETAISFPFPLPEAEANSEGETAVEINYVHAGTPPSQKCPGTELEPAAAEGNMCVYEAGEVENEFLTYANGFSLDNGFNGEAGRHGIVLRFQTTPAGEPNPFTNNQGTWAVTARK